MDLNKVMVIGRLTANPEVRTTPGGDSVVSFSVATNFTWTNKEGNKQEKAEFHNIVAWRKLAEIMAQYLKKGSRIYLDGRLQTRSWEDQNGIKKYRTEIIADNMIMLDSKGSNENFNKTTSEPMAEADTTPVIEEEEINV
ncbi:MAG: single-stranded DNA-binding protein [Candidatus Komeilibacteria bacterium CG_4_9_14_0_8_um_filter_36_9]|nr:MAG: single-stranded DNA-binding protein [Candidatus Komeilibacteria bacterium CG_4_9_14_0_8_um_filter_36_9]